MGNKESKQNNAIDAKSQPAKSQYKNNVAKKKELLNKTNAVAGFSKAAKKSPRPTKDVYQPATTYKFGSSFVPIQNPQNNGGNVVAHTRFENAPPPRHEFHQTIKKQTLVASKHIGSELIPEIAGEEAMNSRNNDNFVASSSINQKAKISKNHKTSDDPLSVHCGDTLRYMYSLKMKNELTDLHIECIDNNTELKMHGAVLAGCSDWYKNEIELGDIPAESSVSKRAEVEAAVAKTEWTTLQLRKNKSIYKLSVQFHSLVVHEFIYFCYHGEFDAMNPGSSTKIRMEGVCEVLKICALLKVLQGKKLATEIIIEKMQVSDFLAIHRMLTICPVPEISNSLWRKCFLEFDRFLGYSDIFKELSNDDVSSLCQRFEIYTSNNKNLGDEHLLQALIKWSSSVETEISTRSAFAQNLVKSHVVFNNCSKIYLATQKKLVLEKLNWNANLLNSFNDALENNNTYSSNDNKKIDNTQNQDHNAEHLDKNLSGFFLISGGRLFDCFNAMILHLDLNDGKWRELVRLPNGALAHHATALLKHKSQANTYLFYVIGGQQGAHVGSLPNNTKTSGNAVPSGPGTSSCYELTCTYQSASDLRRSSETSLNNKTTNTRERRKAQNISTSWKALPELQQSRSHFTISVLGTNLFAIGGRTSQAIRNTCEIIDLDSGKPWKFASPLKIARHSHAASVFGDTVYICGGISAKGDLLTDTLSMQPLQSGMQWTVLESMPIGRASHCMLLTGSDRIIVLGGTVSRYNENDEQNNDNSVICYSAVANKWQPIPTKNSEKLDISLSKLKLATEKTKQRQIDHKMPINLRTNNTDKPGSTDLAESTGVNFGNNKIMMIGGWDAGLRGKFNHSEKVWIFDANNNEWDLGGGLSLRLRAASVSGCFV